MYLQIKYKHFCLKKMLNVKKHKYYVFIIFVASSERFLLCQPKIVTRANGILWMFYNINNHG